MHIWRLMPVKSVHSWLLNLTDQYRSCLSGVLKMNRNGWSDTQLMVVMNDAVGCMRSDYYETITALKLAKFRKLGGGHYGSAWTRKDMDGYALKLSGASPNDSFPAYVYWAMANPMPCIPEYRLPVFSNDRQQFMVMMPAYVNNADVLDYDEDFREARGFLYGGNNIGPRTPLQHACFEIGKFFGGKVQFDLHSDNAMWDEVKGEYVITDPIHQGDTDSLVGEITGKKFTPAPQLDHQLEFGFSPSSPGIWPVPELAGQWRPMHFPAPVKGRPKEPRDMMVQKERPVLNNNQMFVLPKLNINWDVLPNIDRNMFQIQANGQLTAPDALSRAAKWVKDNGLTPQQARKIGAAAQKWDDDALLRAGGNFVELCLLPSLKEFQPLLKDAIPDAGPVGFDRWRVPHSVVRVLRDQWKMGMAHRARGHNLKDIQVMDWR